MTLREAAEALSALVAEHPEIADLELEYGDSESRSDRMDGEVQLVEETDTRIIERPAPSIGNPYTTPPVYSTETHRFLIWNKTYDYSNEKVLAHYPLCTPNKSTTKL